MWAVVAFGERCPFPVFQHKSNNISYQPQKAKYQVGSVAYNNFSFLLVITTIDKMIVYDTYNEIQFKVT